MYFRALIITAFLLLNGCAEMNSRYMKGSEYERALFFYENGRLEEALAKANSIPKDSADYKAARKLASDINSAYMHIARRHMELAEDLEDAGIYGKAIDEYGISLKYNPSNILARNKIQTLSESLRDSDGPDRKNLARSRSKKKEEREDPEYNANLHYMKGKMYFDSRVWGKAAEEFTAALKYVPSYMNADDLLAKSRKERDKLVEKHIKNGIAYFQAEEMELAIKEWDVALEYDPSNKTAADYRSRAEVILERLKKIRGKQDGAERPL